MKVTPNFSKKDLAAMIDDVVEKQVGRDLQELEEIGIKSVERQLLYTAGTYVPENKTTEEMEKTYKDQTGNLRSSIGYVLRRNGRELTKGGFQPNDYGEEHGRQGVIEGPKFARAITPEVRKGLELVIVAGMKYAKAVSVKGYDVLDTANMYAEWRMEKMKRGR